jgi:aminopeptidase
MQRCSIHVGDIVQPAVSARNALECVLEAVAGERALIVCDDEKIKVGQAFAEGALSLGLWTRLLVLRTSRATRTEVPQHLTELIAGRKPEIFVNLLRGAGGETPFRIKLITLETRDKRSRLGHCPGVTLEMLTKGALSLTVEEHRQMQERARSLLRGLQQTTSVEVNAPSGTSLSFSTEGRRFYTDTILDWREMKWMNLPTGEVLAAPVEDSLEGKLVCDLAIGGVGALRKPVELVIKNGTVKSVNSEDKRALRAVEKALNTDKWAKSVGEFAFGINPKAKSFEEFLETEKITETIHIAFGHNLDMPGGRNPSGNHMDFLVAKPTVTITNSKGQASTVLKNGKLQAG